MYSVTTDIAERAKNLNLSKTEVERFSRHILLPEVGLNGQAKLKAAKVLVVGAGGLASPVALYFVAAGVGTLGLVDFDVIDQSNLQRQVLFNEADVGKSKLEVAKSKLNAQSSHTEIIAIAKEINFQNVKEIIAPFDLVIDGTDNFATRYLINDACVLLNKPNIYGSIFRFDGQAAVFYPPNGPCYRCLFPKAPPAEHVPNCAEGGVLGVLPGQIGLIQAAEAIKLILGVGTPLIGRLLLFDALGMKFSESGINADPNCAVCGKNPTICELKAENYRAVCEVSPSVGQSRAERSDLISVEEFQRLRTRGEPYMLIDVRTQAEVSICKISESVNIPMMDLEKRIEELPREKPIIVHCKSGVRSEKALDLLKRNGFEKVKSLRGGILRWIDQYDPGQNKY